MAKSTSVNTNTNHADFLAANSFLLERIKQDIDIHPSDEELKRFQEIAKTIDKERYFTIYGCQSCVRELITFVYSNTKETIPTDSEGGE